MPKLPTTNAIILRVIAFVVAILGVGLTVWFALTSYQHGSTTNAGIGGLLLVVEAVLIARLS